MTAIDPDRLDRVECRDVLDGLASLPDESVQCVVTSPPYWKQRDYGVEGQYGQEDTPEEHVANAVTVFQEVRRVLHPSGTLWMNYGDGYGYAGSRRGGASNHTSSLDGGLKSQNQSRDMFVPIVSGLKNKDVVGMPWMVALALRADGWWLRQDLIWHKPNPHPESMRDRFTKAHEYLFLLAKEERYFFDAEAVREPDVGRDHPRNVLDKPEPSGGVHPPHQGIRHATGRAGAGRTRRSVWTIPPAQLAEAHFATFPEALVEPCIKAGTSEKGICPACGACYVRAISVTYSDERDGNNNLKTKGHGNHDTSLLNRPYATRKTKQTETTGWHPSCECGAGDPMPCVVLDPFAGSATTGVVAIRLGRRFIGFELNPEYAETIAAPRLEAARKGISVKDVRSGQGSLF